MLAGVPDLTLVCLRQGLVILSRAELRDTLHVLSSLSIRCSFRRPFQLSESERKGKFLELKKMSNIYSFEHQFHFEDFQH